ncbi:MAG: N-6 DNA methylase, partial [Bacteroidota bacterium]|nr:N-6 DNA methylase [Bacteroidota bacterium]
ENGVVSEKLKLEYLKTNGAISTPQFLVQDILKRTISKNKIQENGLHGIFQKRILDFACGSGIFLIEIFDYLQNIITEYYNQYQPTDFSELFFKNGNNTTLTIEGKRRLISNCIYAVDIDPEAVEVARMSLSLKVIDSIDFHENYQDIGIYGKQILNNVGSNVKCGNTLVSYDIREEYPDINTNEVQLYKTNPFDWNSEAGFSEIFTDKGGFDFIVGNPPYVEVKNYNVEYPFMHQYLKEKYETTQNGKVDLSVAFIERAIGLLNNQGKLGFIIQKRFFKTEYGKKIREYITSNQLLSQVIDFETTDLFKDRITYIASLILEKSHPEIVSFIKISNQVEEIPAKLESIEPFETDSSSFTVIPSNAFDVNPWNFNDAELLSIKTRLLNRHGKFGDFAKVKVGIQVLWDRAYHLKVKSFNDDGTILCDSHLENDILIEIAACRPLLVNEQFYPFCKDTTTTYVIFPYDVSEEYNDSIRFSDFSSRFPLAGAYLTRNKDEIIANVETCVGNDLWHHFTRVQNHKAIYPKVLIPMTANDTFTAVTQNPNNYCDNANMFFIDIPIKDEPNLYAVASIINSTLFSVCARSIANPQQNGYFKFNKQFIEPIPFPKVNYENNPELIREIARLGKDIERIQNQFISATPRHKNILRNSLNRLWIRLDAKVYELYQLPAEEVEFFTKRGRNINRIEIIELL